MSEKREGTCPLCNQLYDINGECVCDEVDRFFEENRDLMKEIEDIEKEAE